MMRCHALPRMAILLACLVPTLAWCGGDAGPAPGPAPAVASMHAAFAGNDRDAKVAAVRGLAASGLGDAVILPELIAVVGDYQAHAAVVQALRQLTGLHPPVYMHQSHYPDYPWSDDPLAWQTWLADWRRDHDAAADVDEALREAHAALDAAHAAQAASRARAQTADTDTDSSAHP
jgi:hypothetical protein